MKKALFIVDSYNWALYFRASNLEKYLTELNITIKHFKDLDNIEFESFDLVYALNWPIHGYIRKKIKKNRRYRLVTSISSHIGRPKAQGLKGILDNYDAISTSNYFLYREFRPIYKNKVFHTPFGVNSELFLINEQPLRYKNIFGWVGNNTREVKRFDKIERAIKELGGDAILKTATMKDNFGRQEMVNFYNSIGTLICFSTSEGTPNPVLEAASCGRKIISTPVGNVPKLNESGKIIIVNNYSELLSSMKNILNGKYNLNKDGEEVRNTIEKKWDWKIRSGSFKKFLGV